MRAANKGTLVPAEPTEGRAGTKGNPRGQSTHRTQRRARVTQAAERIRQAATRKPKEKLTALLHHITTEALDAAYFSLKGVTGQNSIFGPAPAVSRDEPNNILYIPAMIHRARTRPCHGTAPVGIEKLGGCKSEEVS